MELDIQDLVAEYEYSSRKSLDFCDIEKELLATHIMGQAGAVSSLSEPHRPLTLSPDNAMPTQISGPTPVTDTELEEVFHSCPNADVEACEYCKLINNLVTLNRTFKMRNDHNTVQLLEECIHCVEGCRHFIDILKPQLARFDFSDEVQCNGYRSFVSLSHITVRKCLYVVQDINFLGGLYSAKTHHVLHEKLLDWTKILRLLNVVLQCLYDFAISAKTSSLFTSNREALDKLLSFSKERVNVVGFHGRLLGYQFSKSVRAPIRLLSCIMAAFTHVYNTDSIFRHTIICPPDFLKYWRNPNQRAERIADVCDKNPLDFFMSFWRVQEKGLLRILSNCLGDPVETNLEISIPPTKLVMPTTCGKSVTILPPTEYLGIKPIMVRLVSHKIRHGSVGSATSTAPNQPPQPTRLYGNKIEGMSKSLVIHCHGGGFVAQSSNSHLVYLKHWARGLGVPILSVDYSLAPEAPYPRAIHECFYAYLWALKHAHLLGSTAEKVVVVGDSAGGLLLCGVILLCIELGVRVPDGALLIYTPTLMAPAITPSRLLSLADPLIPYPALAACMGAYLGKTFDQNLAQLPAAFVEGGWEPEEDGNIENCTRQFETLELEELEGVVVPSDDYHLSPLMAPDAILRKFPSTVLATSNFDPCLDDCIEFAIRLKELGVATSVDLQNGVPHGYLNFGKISDECFQGTNACLRRLKELLGINP